MHECLWSHRRAIFEVWGVVLSCWNQKTLRSVRYLSLRCVQKRSSILFDHYLAIATVDPSAARPERGHNAPDSERTLRDDPLWLWRGFSITTSGRSVSHIRQAVAVYTAIKMTLSASLDQASPENLGQILHFFKKPCSGTERFGQCR